MPDLVLTLPAESQAYITVIRDDAEDTFDIIEFLFNYLNDVPSA